MLNVCNNILTFAKLATHYDILHQSLSPILDTSRPGCKSLYTPLGTALNSSEMNGDNKVHASLASLATLGRIHSAEWPMRATVHANAKTQPS